MSAKSREKLRAHKERDARRAEVIAARIAGGCYSVASKSVGTDLLQRELTVVKAYSWTGTRRHGNKTPASLKGQKASHGHDGWNNVSTYGRHGGTDARYSQTVTNRDA